MVLIELWVRDLGVIDEARVVLGPGMTALTGETGAGKTMIVEAIELLVGGRADAGMIRAGADEAVIEGRFELDGTEVVLRRVLTRAGRSRAYHDGAMCTVATLAELGRRLVDLHGQHAHQSLLDRTAQRRSLDRYGAVDVTPLIEAREARRAVDDELAALGGDARARARELDLVRFQLRELDDAGVDDPAEDERLEASERLLGDVAAHREAASAALAALGDGGAADRLGEARGALDGRSPFEALVARLVAVEAELTDLRDELRAVEATLDEDPETLAAVRERRRALRELMKRYGADLTEVIAVREELRERAVALEAHDERVAALEARRAAADAEVAAAAGAVREARRAAAPALAKAIEAHLQGLAMPHARIAIEVDGPAGEEVEILLAANPGTEPSPLAKVASGGELARTMLAMRLVLTDAPPTLVFDEVDAGIGGEVGAVLGANLASLGSQHQVLVVTHLAQVAAHADAQIVVEKLSSETTTRTIVRRADGEDRAREVARMLSGAAAADTALEHARALLSAAGGSV